MKRHPFYLKRNDTSFRYANDRMDVTQHFVKPIRLVRHIQKANKDSLFSGQADC